MTTHEPEPLAAVLGALVELFSEFSVDWYLLGALAAQVYGVVRSTADVDVTVRLDSVPLRALVDALEDGRPHRSR